MTLRTLVLSAFRRRPIRSLLTVCGVGIAFGAFLSFQSLSRGLQANWEGAYERSGTDIVVAQDNVFFSAIDMRIGEEIRHLPGVAAVAPILWGLSIVDGQSGTPLTGWDPEAPVLATLSIRGRRFGTAAPEALLGVNIARRLHKDLGDTVTIGGERLRVVGVFTSTNVLELEGVYVPLALLQKLRGNPGIVGAFYVSVARTGDEPATLAIDRALTRIQTRFPRLVAHRTAELSRNNEVINMARATAWGTSVVAFGMAILGVVNTMSMAVIERTREIGVLRAVGWGRRRVLTLILWEAVSLTAAGAGLGIVLGLTGLRVLAQVPLMRLLAVSKVAPDLYLQTIALAIPLGLLGGWLPAYRATQVSPVEALRYE